MASDLCCMQVKLFQSNVGSEQFQLCVVKTADCHRDLSGGGGGGGLRVINNKISEKG